MGEEPGAGEPGDDPGCKVVQEVIVEQAGVSGRGATWVADQDKNHTKLRRTATELHRKTGIIVAIVHSWQFHLTTMALICVNAVYIGIDADWNKAQTLNDSALGFQIAENFFCTMFTIELCLRFGAF